MGFDKTTVQWSVIGAAPSQEAAPQRHGPPNGQPQRQRAQGTTKKQGQIDRKRKTKSKVAKKKMHMTEPNQETHARARDPIPARQKDHDVVNRMKIKDQTCYSRAVIRV